jgi:adenylosuccinate lyase
VILPDSTILLDYMQQLAIRVIRGLDVDPQRMRENLELTHGALFSQPVLLALVASGLQRDEAYRITQEHAQNAWATRTPLRELLAGDPRTSGLDLDAIFDYAALTRHAGELVARLDAIA